MRIRNIQRRGEDEVGLMMTPMIDIVFQLLVFFIMTFKIVAPEGDFNIKMPIAETRAEGPPPEILPIRVRMTARSDGHLYELRFGDRLMGAPGKPDFTQLRKAVINYLPDEAGPSDLESNEVELDCDYHLKFMYTMEAVTYVSGFVVEEGPHEGEVVKLIENIKFTPRTPTGIAPPE